MKKINFIEAIQRQLPNKVHAGTLSVYIGRAFNQIIYETFRKNSSDLDLFSKTFLNVEVKKDEDQGIYYCKLPVPIIQLPGAGDGVLSVNTMMGRGIEFVATGSSLGRIHEDLEVRDMDGPIPYYVTSGRIEFENKSPIEDISKVKVVLVPSFDALDMLDEVYIPSGKDAEILELVTRFAVGAPVEKEINDQSLKTK